MLMHDKFKIEFHHITPSQDDILFLGTQLTHPENVTRFTVCRIYEDKELVSTGYSFTQCCDNFDRATGRKIALSRALSHFSDKNFRGDIWHAYLNKCKV